jgi:ABC-2 type transport system ATP-binding protein
VQFPAHDASEIERYLAAVREAGLVAEDVEIRKADLEDVFLEVMARKNQPLDSEKQVSGRLPPDSGTAAKPKSVPSGGSAVRETTSMGAK